MRPITPRKVDAPAMVSGYINHLDATWNTSKLEEFFLPMDMEVIQNIPLSLWVQTNFWAWHFKKTGFFGQVVLQNARDNQKSTKTLA
jgi:hypothetical protein